MTELKQFEIILHIGFHKTGTTYLQQHTFPKMKDIFYLGRSWIHKDLNAYFFDLYYQHDDDFNAAEMKTRFYQIVQEAATDCQLDLSSKSKIMISHESLHSGPDYFGTKMEYQAKRIKAVFPHARILITVRNQLKMIESHYTNYIHHGGKMSFKKFYHSEEFNKGLKLKLAYDHIANLYKSLFGLERTSIVVFEEVFTKRGINSAPLLRAVESPKINLEDQKSVNQKLSKASISLIRCVNIIFAKSFYDQYKNRLEGTSSLAEKARWYLIRILKNIQVKSSASSFHYLDDSKRKALNDFYRNSNTNLSGMIGTDLKQLGYS